MTERTRACPSGRQCHRHARHQTQGLPVLRHGFAGAPGAQHCGHEGGAVMKPARVPPYVLWGQAGMPGVHRGGSPGSAQSQGPS